MTTTDPRRTRKSPASAPELPVDLDIASIMPPIPAGTDGMSAAVAEVAAPRPPSLDAAAPQAAGWVTNRMITHLWSYDSSTGVWVWVDGIGWKRLSPASESGHSHMAVLATMATHDNLPVDYHEDAAGRIDQLLV
ncbi:hypothetical protein [Alloactinosynnema sp. L-07]|uniref:hypothetical protein n=1 Tax=Alloactinosynnema sp. L-07 TaxID=1653480 RepID=UPI00065EF58E|nr:hypothetical protein [Alloactinosynnema sp. L-07]CRK60250.1 hypothetical protein [Alloactinosynnema sp. L-07]